MNFFKPLLFISLLINSNFLNSMICGRTISIENQTGLNDLSISFIFPYQILAGGNQVNYDSTDSINLDFNKMNDNKAYFMDNMADNSGPCPNPNLQKTAVCAIKPNFEPILPYAVGFSILSNENNNCDPNDINCPPSSVVDIPLPPARTSEIRQYILKYDEQNKGIVAYWNNNTENSLTAESIYEQDVKC